jgi:N-methylhydantoinase B
MSEQVRIDPIAVEVIGKQLLAAAEEMGVVLVKSSYSTNIKERQDCSTAILDPQGRTVAQAEHIPIHLGSMLGLVENIARRFPLDTIKPGDLFIANDPYNGGGTHLPDITVAAPFFYDGKLLAFVSNIAHHADVGGSPAAPSDIYSEGLRIPPVRVYEGGELRSDVLEMLLLNCRGREERLGDFRAQFAACRIGLQRLETIYAKHGADTVGAAIETLFDQAERQARAAILALPDGVYTFEDVLDDDGVTLDPITIRCELTIEGEHLKLDFAGTAPQVRGPINVTDSALRATVYYVVKAVIDPTMPPNAGFYRTFEIVAPPGSIVNCRPPAPVGLRTDTCQRIVDVVLGAFFGAAPERIPAASHSTILSVLFNGIDPRTGRYFAYPEVIAGGSGACPVMDGVDAVQVHITNTSNLPVESLEVEYPLRVERYELVDDSGGAGRYRGGLGIRRVYRVLADGVRFRSKGDRARNAPWGLDGGLPGGLAALRMNPGETSERSLPFKAFNIQFNQGELLEVITPGGGGYGDPHQRDETARAQDLQDGRVSPAAAEKLYE